jgi:predicted transcriptional regulator|tara:strand:- start:823 stop:1482 length:660 start_codon:yes stop_codon:yes gene_type:complete
MSNFSERVSRILAENELTIIEFCRKIGLSSQTTISKIISENRKPSSKTFGRILKGFPEINYQWLINGDGEMTKTETSRVKGLPISMSGNDDLTVTAKQVISQLDINNKHYTAILDKKMRDDRDYYDNDSKHVKNIAKILEGFKSLEEKVEHYAESASTKVVDMMLKGMKEQNKMLLNGLKKIQTLETDLEDIKTFMAANFELDKMKKKKAKQIKKLTPR